MRERREKGKKKGGRLIITQVYACAHTDAYDHTYTHTHTHTHTHSLTVVGRKAENNRNTELAFL